MEKLLRYSDDLKAWETFAAAALEGWAAGRNQPFELGRDTEPYIVALSCALYADALMFERERRLGDAE